jgi:hypothetical protein
MIGRASISFNSFMCSLSQAHASPPAITSMPRPATTGRGINIALADDQVNLYRVPSGDRILLWRQVWREQLNAQQRHGGSPLVLRYPDGQ